ncbi:MAG: transposase [Herbaspirillum sp.]
MQIGNRFRCYPTPAQEHTLLQWIGCQRHIYNAKVGEDRYFRTFARKSLTHTGQFAPIDQRYSQFKSELTPWLSDVPSTILRNGVVKWKHAYRKFFAKESGRPVIHRNHGKQSVWLTDDLFSFVPVTEANTGEVTHRLLVGLPKFPVGELAFTAHNTYQLPKTIHISITAGRWYVSFNYEDAIPEPTAAETTTWLQQFSAVELAVMTVGLDRGIAIPLAGSNGDNFGFLSIQQQRLSQQERYKKRWQRRQARRDKGSVRWVKAKRKVARYQRYGTDVRQDFAHRTSYALVTDPHYKLFVFEALKVKNMSASAKGTLQNPGKQVRQKAGLNKAILGSAWGKLTVYTQYKARRAGKLCLVVPPQYSSQECAVCGHTHPENRPDQARFICQRCGHTDNADTNAAKVLAQRGINQLLGESNPKKQKQKHQKKQVGVVCSEPIVATQSTLVETSVSRQGSNILAQRPLKRETPATSLRL